MSKEPAPQQRTLILHGGMHKTGTSAIQQYLFERLDAPDVEYFCFDRPNSSQGLLEAFHTRLGELPRYQALGSTPEELDVRRRDARARFQRLLAVTSKQTVIISAESFSLLNLAECEDLERQLRAHFSRIRLVLYIRPLYSRVESAFQQKLKGRFVPLEHKVSPDFRRRINNYDRIFGADDVIIRPYNTAVFPGHSVVNDFLGVCGLKAGEVATGKANVGLSLPAVQLLYIYRKHYPVAAEEDGALIDQLSGMDGERFRLDPALLHEIIDVDDDSDDWLQQRAGISLFDDTECGAVRVRSEQDLLNVSASTLRWLERQTEKHVGSTRRPGLEGIASAMKAWAVELQRSSHTLSATELSGEPIMKRLVLHIGMAKTGTSSIQQTLGESSEVLAGQAVYYPGWKPFNHSFTFTVMFLENPKKSFYYQQLAPIDEPGWEQELHRLGEQWKAFFGSAEKGTWVVSAENLGRLSHGEIAALQAFVEPFFDQVQVIAYVRDPLRALKSQWEQDVKELREPLSGQQVLGLTKKRLNYRFFQRWIDAFGRDQFVLRRFEPETFVGGNLPNDFLQAAQIEVEADLQLPETEANQSLGSEGVALLLAMNSRYPLYRDGQYNAERGLARRLHLFYRAMRDSGATTLPLDVKFNAEEAAGFNRKIGFLNSLLPEGEQFAEVIASDSETVLPDASQVPAEYAVELINHLSHLVDQMADKVDHLQEKVKHLEQEAGKSQ